MTERLSALNPSALTRPCTSRARPGSPQLNEILRDEALWSVGARPEAARRGYDERVLEIFYAELEPASRNATTLREEELPLYFLLQTGIDLGLGPHALREDVCAVLRVRPDPNNWSAYPNVWEETQALAFACPWYRVYDIIERIHRRFQEIDHEDRRKHLAQDFAQAMNEFFKAGPQRGRAHCRHRRDHRELPEPLNRYAEPEKKRSEPPRKGAGLLRQERSDSTTALRCSSGGASRIIKRRLLEKKCASEDQDLGGVIC